MLSNIILVTVVLVGFFVAFFFWGWRLAIYQQKNDESNSSGQNYFAGLDLILKEQTEEAVDFFINALEGRKDCIESHIMLGRLFRKRGEVEQAINVHRTLLANCNLSSKDSMRVHLELSHNYFTAGLLDRAEALLLDMIDVSWCGQKDTLKLLMQIYEQEGEWEKAINLVVIRSHLKIADYKIEVAHYYCELAKIAIDQKEFLQARKYLKSAIRVDNHCARAVLYLGEVELKLTNYNQATKILQRLYTLKPAFIPESIPLLVTCYERMNCLRGLSVYLDKCLRKHLSAAAVVAAAELISKQQGYKEASRFIAAQIVQRPSLRGLNALIDININNTEGKALQHLILLRDLTGNLLKGKPVYFCTDCGFKGKYLHWRCPSCHGWGLIEPIVGIEGQ